MDEKGPGRENGAGRRGCRGAPAPPPPPAPRASLLRQVTSILRKKESVRSADEVALLADKKDMVQEVKFRIRRRQEVLDRSKEIEDDQSELRSKCKTLARALQNANHLVVYTGAGISTAADIPDYRGPNGIWTLLQQGKKIGKHDLTRADPTLTHMALCELYKQRYLKFVVSQNCDGLHLRSGLPKRVLSEVHGNMYIEICKTCKPNVQYWRLFDTTERTARYFHKTGRICHVCGGSLEDSIVHFGERGKVQWPLNWSGALHHAAKADVILCLGSSLKVLKKYPWLWAMDKPIKKRPAVFIVNLQWTPKDDIATLKINGKCDRVMEIVMEYLGLETPKYDRLHDPIFAHTSYLTPPELHTTTQPMLVRSIKLKAENGETEESDDRAGFESLQAKMEVDDSDDDDCPLNILKLKMARNGTLPEDLSMKKYNLEGEVVKYKTKQTADDCDNFSYNLKSDDFCTSEISDRECNNLEETILSNLYEHKREHSAKINPIDLTCGVNITERDLSDIYNYSDVSDSDRQHNSKCVNKLDKFSMELTADDFDQVYVEMKTAENEINRVSILLVNQSKYITNRNKDNSRIQNGNTKLIKEICSQDQLKTKHNGEVEFTNLFNRAINMNSNSKLSILNPVNVVSMANENRILARFPSSESSVIQKEKNKFYNSLKTLRKMKNLPNLFSKKENTNFISLQKINAYASNVSSSLQNYCDKMLRNKIDESRKHYQEPLDCSLPSTSVIPFKRICQQIFNSNNSDHVFSNPTLLPMCEDNISVNNIAVDLSTTTSPNDNKEGKIRLQNVLCVRPKLFGLHGNLNYNMGKFNTDLNRNSFTIFERKCESFAKIIIQNTLLVNHKELQCAYSGLHSIINPVPFCTDYDFKSVFNSFSFIRLAQKLISKNRITGSVLKNETTSKKQKLKYAKRLCTRKKKEPRCKFCYDHYRSYACNFYEGYNSEKRFEKWRNSKLVMCECCDTDTSDVEEDSSESCEESDPKEEKQPPSAEPNPETSSVNLTEGRILRNRCNDDLKSSVQTNVADDKTNGDSDNVAQAGWFGKGFRKNRRRRR